MAVLNMYKRFEIRYNDRDYKVGDILELHELTPLQGDEATYTGNYIVAKINYILSDFEGLAPGYVAINLVRMKMEEATTS